MYRRFSLPSHDRVFRAYGGGGLHNCGPNPCLEAYLEHEPLPRSLDLSYAYSKGDLKTIKRLCRRRTIIYLGDFNAPSREVVEIYRSIMELMAPDVIVIPVLSARVEDDPAALYSRLRGISSEYARRMEWGWLA